MSVVGDDLIEAAHPVDDGRQHAAGEPSADKGRDPPHHDGIEDVLEAHVAIDGQGRHRE